MQFTSDNKKLYILRKLLGVYDNGISQNLKSIEKAFRETFEIDIESDEFFETLIKAEDMIKKISLRVLDQKLNKMNERVMEAGENYGIDCLELSEDELIDINCYKFFLRKLLKNHPNIPIKALCPLLSENLFEYLTRVSEISCFGDLIYFSKYLEVDLPMLELIQMQELKAFIHSCGFLLKDETIEEISIETFDNMYIYDWKDPLHSTKVSLTTDIFDLPISKEAIFFLQSNNVNTFEDLLKLNMEDIEEIFGTNKEKPYIKRLLLNCSAYDFVKNSDNVYFPTKR